MPGSQPNDNSEVPNTRVGRLLRERELRRSRIPDGTDGNKELEISDGDFSAPPNQEHSFEGSASAPNEGSERPIKQRLLVVANRLPVSAVRRDVDSWSLEISAGGLVSALLGVLLLFILLISASSSISIGLRSLTNLLILFCFTYI